MEKSADCYVNLNTKDQNIETAFHLAYRQGHLEIVEILLEKSVEYDTNLNPKYENYCEAVVFQSRERYTVLQRKILGKPRFMY